MKLTEILVCTALFLLASIIFLGTLVITRNGATNAILKTESIQDIISADSFLREKIWERKISYWNNLANECSIIEEQLKLNEENIGIHILSVHPVVDEQNVSEGICIEWNKGNNNYVTQEYIRQRIINEEK